MNSTGRSDKAQKAAVPLSNYEFDFGLGSNFSTSQKSKSLKEQKHNPTPIQPFSASQTHKPAPAWTPNKPSWTPQPSSTPAYKPAQAGVSSGWSGQSGISSVWSAQPQMAGDIHGKSWAKPDSSKQVASGIVGGLNSGAAPHLFGDLLGAALGQQKNNTPLKQTSPNTSFSMSGMSAALPKGGISLKDHRSAVRSAPVEQFGNFAGANSNSGNASGGGDPFDALPTFSNKSFNSSQGGHPFVAKEVPLKSTSTVSQDPFASPSNEGVFGVFPNISATNNLVNDDGFGDFQKGSASHSSSATVSGDPFAASMNVSDDLFSGASIPNSSNAGDPFSGLSFGATGGKNGNTQFIDPLTSFASSTKAPAKAADPFEALNKSFTSQKQVAQEKSKDPLDSLFTSSTASQRGFTSQPLSETDDWGLDGDFGGADTGPTTELEGLPPPPAGVNISIAKDKGMESYKQGQFAEAIKWLSWAMVLLEKGGEDYGVSAEVLTCRASCYKEVGEYKKAISDCSQVLDHDKSNAAVLIQRALLYESTEKYKLGADDLRNVLKLDPANRLAKNTLSRLIKMAD
ncbi:hypothetical protein SUGI_0137670 [Cryptomeria japonica]|uniref:uncharacterized protein LOC131056065 n=1 Tax=Cryptomeria japonica TaxID=3369 RepID=UPI002408D667|nr:uncharacterized protein LOC131056065 [Cryptomeria japonica]GLJ10903.1 hypothetical protein SUGI_0137670 [Cryptomeria japonica]